MVLQIVLVGLAAWLLVSVVLALVIGRTIRLADRRHQRMVASPLRVARAGAARRVPVKV